MHQTATIDREEPLTLSVLARLRRLIPDRSDLSFAELLRIAELQSNTLLRLHDIHDGPTPSEIITELPKIRMVTTGRLIDGASYWDSQRQEWIIQLSRADSRRRRRFTLAHEYKHIVDHVSRERLYRSTKPTPAVVQAEQVADYFAGCLLIPRRLLKRAWGSGIQTTDALAEYFDVSEQAIGVRLRQTGLVDERLPCIDVDAGQAVQPWQPTSVGSRVVLHTRGFRL